jgi:dolichol-phosphate mannosyltransferase
MKRWLKFNAVGAAGIVVQLGVLALLKGVLKIAYLTATAFAVEAAIVQNFFWHERFTWADRSHMRPLRRFLKFNFTTGAISLLGNLGLMRMLAGQFHLHYLIGNCISIAVCSIANFTASDRFVFNRKPATSSSTSPAL